jgi:hypothetical protein
MVLTLGTTDVWLEHNRHMLMDYTDGELWVGMLPALPQQVYTHCTQGAARAVWS